MNIRTPNLLLFCLTFLSTSVFITTLAAEIGTSREWTDVQGRTIRATLIEIGNDFIKINREGVVHEIPISRLSRGCQAWLSSIPRPATEEDDDKKEQDGGDAGAAAKAQLELLSLPPSDAIREIVRGAAYDVRSTNRPGEFLRMQGPVSISVHGGTDRQREEVARCITMLDDVTRHGRLRLRQLRDNSNADIMIFMAPEDELPELAKKNDFSVLLGSSMFWAHKSRGDLFTGGAIFIDPEKRRGQSLSRGIVRGIVACIGIRGTVAEPEGSMFCQKFGTFDPSGITPFDQAVIIFCLRNLSPGAKDADFTRTFNGRWPETVRLVERETSGN